jgi:hypothetical protein
MIERPQKVRHQLGAFFTPYFFLTYSPLELLYLLYLTIADAHRLRQRNPTCNCAIDIKTKEWITKRQMSAVLLPSFPIR